MRRSRLLDSRGVSLIGWMIVLGLIAFLLAEMTSLNSLSSKKNLGDQTVAIRNTILKTAMTYGQNGQALYYSAMNPQNPALNGCVNAVSCVSGQASGFFLSDASGTQTIAGTPASPVYYTINGQPCPIASPLANAKCPLQAVASFTPTCSPTPSDCSNPGDVSITVTTSLSMDKSLIPTGLGRVDAASSTSSPIPVTQILTPSPSPSPSSSPSPSPSPSPSSSATPAPSCTPAQETCGSCVQMDPATISMGNDSSTKGDCAMGPTNPTASLFVCCYPSETMYQPPAPKNAQCCSSGGASPLPSPTPLPSCNLSCNPPDGTSCTRPCGTGGGVTYILQGTIKCNTCTGVGHCSNFCGGEPVVNCQCM